MFWRTSKFARAWNLTNDEKLDLQQATWVFLLENIAKLDKHDNVVIKTSALSNLCKESCRNWLFKNKGHGSKSGRKEAMTEYSEVKEDMLSSGNPVDQMLVGDMMAKLNQVGLHILTKDQFLSLFDEDQIGDRSRQARFDLRNKAVNKMKTHIKDNWK
jgi:hypothetical protein